MRRGFPSQRDTGMEGPEDTRIQQGTDGDANLIPVNHLPQRVPAICSPPPPTPPQLPQQMVPFPPGPLGSALAPFLTTQSSFRLPRIWTLRAPFSLRHPDCCCCRVKGL